MAILSETETFGRACAKAIDKLSRMPDGLSKSSYAGPDLLSNARAMLAHAEAVRAAAASVVAQLQPPPPPAVHTHHHREPIFRDGSATVVASA